MLCKTLFKRYDDSDIVLFQIYWSMSTKIYQNTAWFDSYCKNKMVHFLTHSVLYDNNISISHISIHHVTNNKHLYITQTVL